MHTFCDIKDYFLEDYWPRCWKVVFAEKILDLDTKVSAEKTMVNLVFEINDDGIRMVITLMD